MITECFYCGFDCSHCYATWKGNTYHIGCLPAPRKIRRTVLEFEGERYPLTYRDERDDPDNINAAAARGEDVER
jgi:hypothetical protein